MKNCWEVKNCQRQSSGLKAAELGICPAAKSSRFDGKNQGTLSGRYCWKVAGTLCGGKVQGTFADKLMDCVTCEFYINVKKEEGAAFQN